MKHNHQGNHTFSQTPRADIQRSTFDRSHTVKTTFDSGLIIPIYADEVLPGDTFKLNMHAFARLATPLKPFMDNLYLDSFFFAVPYRLVWTNWQKFNGEQLSPGDSTDFRVPVFNFGAGITDQTSTPTVGTLSDYLGIPTDVSMSNYSVGSPFTINSLHHRAYNLIFNEWFRDENLVTPRVVDTDDGPDNIADYAIQRRGKRHDYFTSCLPWPQKSVDTLIPFLKTDNTSVPVLGAAAPSAASYTTGGTYRDSSGNNATYANIFQNNQVFFEKNTGSGAPYPNLHVVLTDAMAASINSLRQAFQIQKLYERDARGGTRYTEIIRAHFGVTSPDSRLQRPEYLGGGSTMINVHPLAQTSASVTGDTPQGNLAAFATAGIHAHGFTKSFTEHCLILGLISVRAELTYQQGLNKMFTRRTRFDYYWPALSHLGEQVVSGSEIYLSPTVSYNSNVFGYQERYAEYRYKPSIITGKFRSSASGTLDMWHLSQNFTSQPGLNAAFISETPPISRVVAVPSEPQFLFDAFIDLKCTRPMPVYSVPGLVDHF